MTPTLTAVAITTAVVLLIPYLYATYRAWKMIGTLNAKLIQLEACLNSVQARTSTVKTTQEILPSPYIHDRTSTRPVSPSPLIRSFNHDRYEVVPGPHRPVDRGGVSTR